MAENNNSLFLWPANPSLTAFHLLARATLLLVNAVGLSVSYAAGANSRAVSVWVGAAFMSASLLFFQPLFILWNKKQLNRSKMAMLESGQHRDVRSIGFSPQAVSTKFLEFSITMDTVGMLAYWIIWGFTIRDSVSGRDVRYWSPVNGRVALITYAGAATLTCAIIHSLLLVTQLLQLRNGYRSKQTCMAVCPHCNHSLDSMTVRTKDIRTDRASPSPAATQPEEYQNLLGQDTDDDEYNDARTVIDMAPGQETGTCAITPRVSTSNGGLTSDDVGVANDSGTGEGDRLIEKSK